MAKILSTLLILLAIIAITYGRSTGYKVDQLEFTNEDKTYERKDEAVNIGLNSNSEDDNTSEGNTGDDITDEGNASEDNTGEDNTSEDNTGDDSTDEGNTSEDNTGEGNTGEDNTGDDSTGEDNTGEDNTGEGDMDEDNTYGDEKIEDRITQLENEIYVLQLTDVELENEIYALKLTDVERIAQCGVINSIDDDRITASSMSNNYHGPGWGPQHSRLYSVSGKGGWLPNRPYEGSWIEIDLGTKKKVRGVATQARYRSRSKLQTAWIESFTIGFKTSTSSKLQYIEDPSGAKNIFQGNTNEYLVVINDVDVEARFIRIYPISWSEYPVLRFDILLC